MHWLNPYDPIMVTLLKSPMLTKEVQPSNVSEGISFRLLKSPTVSSAVHPMKHCIPIDSNLGILPIDFSAMQPLKTELSMLVTLLKSPMLTSALQPKNALLPMAVSLSEQSTLINDILYNALAAKLHGARLRPADHKEILGLSEIDKVINIDQSPIGRTPRSNPATYTGVFDFIRELFSQTNEAKLRGYKPGRFSFNVKGGRCEACRGDGMNKIEMHFLPDVYVPCEVCHGARYNRDTLEVHYKGKTIAEVLDMTVTEACEFFKNLPRIYRKLEVLEDVGLGYIRLGQAATTLSGGEAQRVKLATELSRRSTGKTLYILDEPTTGLHIADVHKLLEVLQRLVGAGDSVVVIEHNLDVIKTADYIIDLGPEGGDKGGTLLACGTPEEVAKNKKSYTGQYIKQALAQAKKHGWYQ